MDVGGVGRLAGIGGRDSISVIIKHFSLKSYQQQVKKSLFPTNSGFGTMGTWQLPHP